MCPVHGGVWSGYKRLSRAQHEPALTSCACCDGDGTSPRPSHRSPRPCAGRRAGWSSIGAGRFDFRAHRSRRSVGDVGAGGSRSREPGTGSACEHSSQVGGIILGQRIAPRRAASSKTVNSLDGRCDLRYEKPVRPSRAARGTRALRIGGQRSLDRGEVTTHTSVTQAHT